MILNKNAYTHKPKQSHTHLATEYLTQDQQVAVEIARKLRPKIRKRVIGNITEQPYHKCL